MLELVRDLYLPDCWIAAGFVRIKVWDYIHGYQDSILNDIDVIYYDPIDLDSRLERDAELKLSKIIPSCNWQVRNQARMHIRNGHNPYASSSDAMRYWPEIETAVAIRLEKDGNLFVSAPFGTDSLENGKLTFNPNSTLSIFRKRILDKGWLVKYPSLKLDETVHTKYLNYKPVSNQ